MRIFFLCGFVNTAKIKRAREWFSGSKVETSEIKHKYNEYMYREKTEHKSKKPKKAFPYLLRENNFTQLDCF